MESIEYIAMETLVRKQTNATTYPTLSVGKNNINHIEH